MNKTEAFLNEYLDAKRMATIDLMVATARIKGRPKLAPLVYRAYVTVLDERKAQAYPRAA